MDRFKLIVLAFKLIIAMGEFQDQVAESCTDYFNRFRRQTYVTPKSYLSFLMGYKKIYAEKRKTIGVLAERMNTGLNHTKNLIVFRFDLNFFF
jgi:dynein heavy chain